MLIDIVSKNGNLLLNVPPKADGTLDEQAVYILEEIGNWIDINGQAVYATRPWIRYGEGPTALQQGQFKDRNIAFTAKDIRFTTKGTTLYAICMDWPRHEEDLLIESLSSRNQPAKISTVTLLGHDAKLQWHWDAQGLRIKMPSQKPCDYASAFRIVWEESP
jgi:alpha-L-fucosidase